MMAANQQLKAFQHSWSQHKYWVMARSQQSYNEIRLMAKNNQWQAAKQQRYEAILSQLAQVQPTEKTLRVTYQHIWGYFKKQATADEKRQYDYLMEQPLQQSMTIKGFLQTLTNKYQNAYLQKIKWP